MSKFSCKLSALLDFNTFVPTGSRPSATFVQEVSGQNIDATNNSDATNVLVFKEFKDRATDVAVDLAATTGALGENVAFQSVRFAVVAIRRTAETVSGSVSITVPQFGITTGALNIGNMAGALAEIPIGGYLHFVAGFNAGGIVVGATNVTADFTNPVGFVADIIYIGDSAD